MAIPAKMEWQMGAQAMTRWNGTRAELRAHIKVPQPKVVWEALETPEEPRASKYGNVPTLVDGRRFDSKAEANRYRELCLLERAGTISDLECQPRYVLGTGKRPPVYVGDFAYIEDGKPICEDVKGVQTAVFKLKAKLFRERYPDIELRITE